MSDFPRFAIVGHPNKGKSSLVATLARDEQVEVGSSPGTTKRSERYPLRVRGQTLYELIDTPGFQRPRQVLEWLHRHDQGTAARPHVLRAFTELEENQRKFPDECELLRPIVEGAAIVYVVDGSLPFSEEYELELEILRWSDSPRMGLVNPIANEAYVQDWRTALGQFCHSVRVFNPVHADFEKCIELLEVCAGLSEDWAPALKKAITVLREDRRLSFEASVLEILDLLLRSVSFSIEEKVDPSRERSEQGAALIERFKQELRSQELGARARVEHLYHYHKLNRNEEQIQLVDSLDLFSNEAWEVFGLTRRQLTKLSALAGAAAGGAIDVLTGGSSLALGAAAGGIFAGGAAWFLGERLVDQSLWYVPVGKRLLRVGPLQNSQFAFVLLNRARLHLAMVARRAHADRSNLSLQAMAQENLAALEDEDMRVLDRCFRAVRAHKSDDKVRQKLKERITLLCTRDYENHSDTD